MVRVCASDLVQRKATGETNYDRSPLPAAVDWDIDAAFFVTDSAGQQLAYVYFEDEPGRRSAAKLLSKD